MVSECSPRILLALFIVALPPAIIAKDCASSAASSVRVSATSYRNLTGHWINQAVVTRRSSRVGSDMRKEEKPWHYEIDFARQNCAEDDIMTTVFSVVAPPARVGAGYTFFPNVGSYKLHTEKMNWEDARRTCEKEGGHLAIVNSEAEENAIREVMIAHSKEDYPAFIGFHDKFEEGEYVTVLGDPLSSTGRVRWKNGQPDNYPNSSEGEDCGNIDIYGKLNDLSCYWEEPFICEQSLY